MDSSIDYQTITSYEGQLAYARAVALGLVEFLNLKKKVAPRKSNEEIAREVIRGLWGNGEARKYRLTHAGYNYSTIQQIVNKLLK